MERWRKPWVEQDKRTGYWNLRWRELGEDGKIVKKSLRCADNDDAEQRCDAKEDELRQRNYTTVNPSTELDALYKRYMFVKERVKGLRPGALKAKREALDRYVAVTKTIGAINRESLTSYRDDLLATLSPVTTAIRLREIKAFTRWLWLEGKLALNPFINIEIPRQDPIPRFLTDDEIIALEKVSTGTFRAILRMAYLTGMRQNELLQAQWEWISWLRDPKTNRRRAFITIPSKTAKNRRTRTIALRAEVTALLGSGSRGPLFPGWDKWKLRWAWDCAKAKCGFKDRVRFHDLRHTFCRLYLQGRGTIADLMANTGHQSLAMMQIYAHFESRWKAERMDAISMPEGFTGQFTGRSQDLGDGFSVIQGDIPTDEVTESNLAVLPKLPLIQLEGEGDSPCNTEGKVG